ncbi:MAG: HipA N-terminal domain-containing protein [Eggerthellaceae bacterium]|nr:HipA N-terminal domain-containing protein [Eggerthellaceae bacterium]
MRALEVWLQGELFGRISQTRAGGRFAYDQSIAGANPGTPLLSLSMPAKARAFGEAKTANWFEGLLPEGQRRDEACRRLGLSPHDRLGLIAEIGWECAGAVRVLEAGDEQGRTESYEPVAEDALAEMLDDLPSRQPTPGARFVPHVARRLPGQAVRRHAPT